VNACLERERISARSADYASRAAVRQDFLAALDFDGGAGAREPSGERGEPVTLRSIPQDHRPPERHFWAPSDLRHVD